MPAPANSAAEWLETDGLGGFATGTASGVRTRRYHALLCAAVRPPSDRRVLVAGVEVWAVLGDRRIALTSHRYAPDVVHPDGAERILQFRARPHPSWTFALPGGETIQFDLMMMHGSAAVALRWRASGGSEPLRLEVRPFLAGRGFHELQHENGALRMDAALEPNGVRWRTYGGVPPVTAHHDGRYEQAPDWYRNFLYEAERDRGLDDTEDLASPGIFHFDLRDREARVAFTAPVPDGSPWNAPGAMTQFDGAWERELARRAAVAGGGGALESELRLSADAYFAARGSGKTIIAGFPWFGDWGRDAFIAMRGLCLSTGRLDDAERILTAWAGAVSEGMLPNRFPDAGEEPEYNSVDASLWYVIAAFEWRRRAPHRREAWRAVETAIDAILDGYARGTRFGIRADADGLLRCGEAGTQLTWMDARIGDRPVTPRIGKPVEVQALWLNALALAGETSPARKQLYLRGKESFEGAFWNEHRRCLYDVVGADGAASDASMRPNQIFAAGGLPYVLLAPDRARAVVDAVERELVTPLGLRSLARGEPGYVPRYEGGVRERDGAYHMGTVWPWLAGPFAQAWVRVRGGGDDAKSEARRRFVEPLAAHLGAYGLHHVAEIADGDPPHAPRGCPFQAWSVGELLRMIEFLGAR